MNNIRLLLLAASCCLLASCASNTMLRGEKYALFYEEQPKSVLIMPPVNNTNFAEAKEYFYTTLALPLAEKGYYVFSPYLSMDLFQIEGAYESENFIEGNLKPFNKVFGCDAVMFTVIKDWSKKAASGKIKVNIDYIMRSATTGEVIYSNEGQMTLDTSVKSGNGSLIGMVADMAATAIKTAMVEKVVAGRACNQYILADLPEGPYSPDYLTDQKEKAWKGVVKAKVKAK